MAKKLSEMTLEELWELFPIFLVPHKTEWKSWFAEEKTLIEDLLPEALRISHIGSTAIPGIYAKAIVDILIELPKDSDMQKAADILRANSFIQMSAEHGRISLNKGYTEKGFAERVFHLHLRFFGDNDELYFRDLLLSDAGLAHEYEALKLSLAGDFKHDRDGYTAAKGDFIRRNTEKAKEIYRGRY